MHKTRDNDECRRLNVILLLSSGHSVTEVSSLIAAARSSINRWVGWYTECGIEGIESSTRGCSRVLPFYQIGRMLKLMLQLSLQAQGYQCSRWSIELIAIEINHMFSLQVHSSMIRRCLPKLGIVRRLAAPTLHIRDPLRDDKLKAIRDALQHRDIDHPVFYEDEVDIHLNPKIGADWMDKGHQKRVPTPGQNAKRYLTDALHSGTGKVSYVASASKDSTLLKLLKRQ